MNNPVAPSNGYAAAALRGECDKVSSAADGTRNHVLNVAAFNMGGIINSGEIDEMTVVDALTSAARSAGLEEFEIAATIRSGFSSRGRWFG